MNMWTTRLLIEQHNRNIKRLRRKQQALILYGIVAAAVLVFPAICILGATIG